MENASKALLIAGSVLIVILLIAVGMRVFNSTSGTTDSVEQTMDSTEIAMFNNKFLQYVGTNKSKAQAISFLNLIISHNSTMWQNSNAEKRVSVSTVSTGTRDGSAWGNNAITQIISNIQNDPGNTTYTIIVEHDDITGYINFAKVLNEQKK